MKKVIVLFYIATLVAISNSAAQVVSITATDGFATEDPGDTATFQISRDGGIISTDLAVDIGVDNANTQANSSDYSLNPPLAGLVIPAGASSITVTMTAADDFAAEAEEELTLEVLANANYTVGANSQATAAIDANDFGVTNTNDFDPFLGTPTPAQREGTLRQAIENAHDFGSNPLIAFSDNPFTVGPQRTISLTGGELFIEQEMSIEGPGADQLILEGFDLKRILNISDTNEAFAIEISGITFQSGTAFTTGPAGRGGAILADSDSGDGINLTLTECSFSENRAIEGAAVVFENRNGSLKIERCLFEGNLSSSEGGALAFYAGTNLTVRDSTFANNESSGRAGAVLVLASDSTTEIVNATIVGNRTDENDGGQPEDLGGGLFVGTGVPCVIHNTLIAGNLRGSSTPANDDISGSVAATSRNNLIADPATAGGLIHDTLDNILGTEDRLNPGPRILLALRDVIETDRFNNDAPLVEDHGGPTRAVRILRFGPAVANGSFDVITSDDDQRGTGFPRTLSANPSLSNGESGSPDIGALEFDPILVTTLTDENDGTPDSGVGDGTSLREAIAKANLHPGTDLIVFSRGNGTTTDFFDVADPKTMRPFSSFNVRTSTDIEGPGAFFLTLDGDIDQFGTANDGDTRLFIFSDPIFVDRTPDSRLSGMTLANGSNWEESNLGNGGAILNGASLVVQEVIFNGNTAVDGGAIYSSGAFNLIRCTVDGNTAQRNGGGVYTKQILFAAQLSTLSNNSAGEDGGGIYTESGSFQLLNSTLSANQAPDGGGLFYEGGDARIANSTIAENIATSSTSGAGIDISGLAAPSMLELDNTIVAGNRIDPAGSSSDIAGGTLATASINNLIGDANTAGGLVNGDNDNIVGDGGTGTLDFNSILEPIGFNGGFTQTYLPAFESFVIDSGDDSSARFDSGGQLRTDQRGLPRITGFAVDIGSVELEDAVLILEEIDDQSVPENEFISFTATATDNSGSAGGIIFTLEDGEFGFVPDGADIDSDTGEFSWQTEEFDGPSFYEFDVVATLADDTSISDRQTIFIDVFEENEPPFIEPINDMTVEAGVQLAFTATAFDPDIPQNFLTFSLDPASESLGMQIDPDTGEFTWTPTTPGSFPVEITVEDDGGGDVPLADSTSFNIEVTGGSMPLVSLSTSPGSETLHEPESFSKSPDGVSASPHLTLQRGGSSGDLTIGLQIDNSSAADYGTDFQVFFATDIVGPFQPLLFSGNPSVANVTIPNNESRLVLRLDLTNDAAAEAAESINFSIIPRGDFNIGNGSSTITIAQNDFVVTSLADFDPTTTPNGGEGTLRQAVINAKSGLTFPISSGLVPKAPITFDAALAGEILLTSGPLLLENESTEIAGPGSDIITVSAGLNSRVFIFHDPDIPFGDLHFDLSGLRIESGFTTGNGGGIFNSERLTIDRCSISSCVANQGGAITNEGNLVIENCRVADNSALVYGGGIDNHGGNFFIRYSSITGNTADFGGGIENSSAGEIFVDSCAVFDNTATQSGGGIDCYTGTARIYNSTISQNHAGYGAGIFNEQSNVTILNSTIASNTAQTSTGGVLSSSNAPVATTLVHNSIIAGNLDGDVSTNDPSFVDLATASSNNLIGAAISSGGLVDGVNNNLVGIAGTDTIPLGEILAPLADNGGPTVTHALVAGSQAIDAGSDLFAQLPPFNDDEASTFIFDQRGPIFDRTIGTSVDIGAFEVQPEILEAVSCELSEGPAAKITWRSAPGETYDVLCSTDLKNWITVAEAVPATGALTNFTDENPPAGQAYFIVRKSQP